MSTFEVYRGDEKIAFFDEKGLWVLDDMDGACRLVAALVQLGVPAERKRENREILWRVQVQDPDFALALREYLEAGQAVAFRLTVRSSDIPENPEIGDST